MWYKDKKRAMQSAVIKAAGGKDATKESILKVLFGDDFNDRTEFYVYWWDNPYEKETAWWQRVNKLWFIPLFLIFIAPVQYLVKGHVGFDSRTKIGEIILKLIGEK